MSPAQNSTQPEEPPKSRSLRKVTTLSRMTESITKELNESLCCVIINASTCLRMLSADRPNVEEARETLRRTIRACNRAADAVSQLSDLLGETDRVIPTAPASIKGASPDKTEGTG